MTTASLQGAMRLRTLSPAVFTIQIYLALIPLLSAMAGVGVGATQSPSTSPPTTPTSPPSSASTPQATSSSQVLHPAQGETVVYHSQYTIQWTPPAIPGSISIELWDTDDWSWASSFDTGDPVNVTGSTSLRGCDGWLINTQCGKIARSVPNSGSYVWNMSSTIAYETLSGVFNYYMGIYIQQSDVDVVPSEKSLWYVKSGTFVVAAAAMSSSSGSGSGSSTLLRPSTTLSSSIESRASGGPAATSSTGVGATTATAEFGWGVLGLLGILLAMW